MLLRLITALVLLLLNFVCAASAQDLMSSGFPTNGPVGTTSVQPPTFQAQPFASPSAVVTQGELNQYGSQNYWGDQLTSQPVYSSGTASVYPQMPYMAVDWSDNYEVTFTLDTLFLTRDSLEAGDFVFDGMGAPVMNFSDVDMGFQPGPRVSCLFGGRVSGLEIAGFGFNKIGETTLVNAPGVTPVFFNAIPADPQNSYNIVATSRLYNLEGNFWYAPLLKIATRCRPALRKPERQIRRNFSGWRSGRSRVLWRL